MDRRAVPFLRRSRPILETRSLPWRFANPPPVPETVLRA